MPNASLANISNAYESPPESIRQINPDLHDYLLVLHQRVFGIKKTGGDIGMDNVNAADLNLHGKGTDHGLMIPGDSINAVADIDSSIAPEAEGLLVENADAGGVYTAAEINLINETKADLNTFFAEYQAWLPLLISLITEFNNLVASLKAAKIIKEE